MSSPRPVLKCVSMKEKPNARSQSRPSVSATAEGHLQCSWRNWLTDPPVAPVFHALLTAERAAWPFLSRMRRSLRPLRQVRGVRPPQPSPPRHRAVASRAAAGLTGRRCGFLFTPTSQRKQTDDTVDGLNQVSTSSAVEGRELPARSPGDGAAVGGLGGLGGGALRATAVHYVLEESSGYMEPALRILAVLHTAISFCCIIGYYCLKVSAGPARCIRAAGPIRDGRCVRGLTRACPGNPHPWGKGRAQDAGRDKWGPALTAGGHRRPGAWEAGPAVSTLTALAPGRGVPPGCLTEAFFHY